MDWRLFSEEQIWAVKRKITIDLIRTYLMIPDVPERSTRIHHGGSSDDVRLQEDTGIFDGAIHMAFGGEVDHNIRLLFLKQSHDPLAVTDVKLTEAEIWVVHHGRQCRQVARVGQFINTNDPIIRVTVEIIMYKVTADETGSTCYEDCGHNDFGSFSISEDSVFLLWPAFPISTSKP